MKELCITYPSLPFLSEVMQCTITQILAKIHGANFMRRIVLSELQESLISSVSSFIDFRKALISHIQEVVKERVKDVKTVPITIRGPQSELRSVISKRFARTLSTVDIQLRERTRREKIYDWFGDEVLRAFINFINRTIQSENDFRREFSGEWRIEVTRSSINILSPGRAEYNFPAIIRTSLLYEQARLFGLRDTKPRGSVSKGVLRLRCSPLWYMFLLSGVISSLATRIQLTKGEDIHLYVGLSLHPMINYEISEVQTLNEGITVVREVCRRSPFLEDLDLMRYLIIFNLYIRKAFTLNPAEYVIYGIKPEGARFTSRFNFSISTEELSVLDKKLETIWGDERDDVIIALRDFGECLVRLYRIPAFQQELPLDRLITTYKLICYAATEPGYKSPLDLIYELLRILKEETVEARLKGLLRRYLQETYKLSEEKAKERIDHVWRRLISLAEIA